MHNYQNAESSASYLLRNVRLGDTEASILHNVQMNWDFLCHETRAFFFSLKNFFYETIVSFGVEKSLGFRKQTSNGAFTFKKLKIGSSFNTTANYVIMLGL